MKSKTTQIIESTLNEQNPDLVIVERKGSNAFMVFSKNNMSGFKRIVLPDTNVGQEGPEYDELYEIENNPEYSRVEEIY
jgi:hypothetical protein